MEALGPSPEANRVSAELRVDRRHFSLLSTLPFLSLPLSLFLSPSAQAEPILGDPSVSLADVTPTIAPQTKLTLSEESVTRMFEATTYSVVNIFDITMRPSANVQGQVEIPEGNGSGIVWDTLGHVITNYHVIGSALSQNRPLGSPVARVTLLGADGLQRNFQGTLVGADKGKDLAVLQINAPPDLLKPIALGDSSALRVGQRCFAIGNPFGFDHTLTAGIVSGLNRDIYSANRVVIGGGVQTDAAINPGNSGGPLLDASGALIGVNTAIVTDRGISAGVGFAISTSVVSKIIPQLIASGKVTRPTLGVQLASESVANRLGVKEGALILSVMPGSSAEQAGLQGTRRGLAGNIVIGDILIQIQTRKVLGPSSVEKIVDDLSVGDDVSIKVKRGDDFLDFSVKLMADSQ